MGGAGTAGGLMGAYIVVASWARVRRGAAANVVFFHNSIVEWTDF